MRSARSAITSGIIWAHRIANRRFAAARCNSSPLHAADGVSGLCLAVVWPAVGGRRGCCDIPGPCISRRRGPRQCSRVKGIVQESGHVPPAGALLSRTNSSRAPPSGSCPACLNAASAALSQLLKISLPSPAQHRPHSPSRSLPRQFVSAPRCCRCSCAGCDNSSAARRLSPCRRSVSQRSLTTTSLDLVRRIPPPGDAQPPPQIQRRPHRAHSHDARTLERHIATSTPVLGRTLVSSPGTGLLRP
jgi:hypothetical protein